MTKTFKDFNLSARTMQGLERLGFEAPTPVQAQTIIPFAEGSDLIVQAPTGTGKTCAFGIPACEQIDPYSQDVQLLVLCPTRELALQTFHVLKNLTYFMKKLRLAAIYGGEPIQKQFSVLRSHPQIVIATPGRLIDHMERRTIKLGGVKTLVLDEADRMLDMGFKKDLEKILQQTPDERQTVLFSATMAKEVMAITKKYQRGAQSIVVGQKKERLRAIEQRYSEVEPAQKNSALISLLKDNAYHLSLVFVNTRHKADKVARQLAKNGFRADALHGDKTQKNRDRTMNSYRSGKLDVLVATDVAARGIDVENIDAVINYDLPNDCDSYIHRIGRTGRAQQCGTAHTLLCREELAKYRVYAKASQRAIAH